MCTITIARDLFDGLPLVVGANREERYERPAQGPDIRNDVSTRLAPRDLVAGGTWIGVNAHGVFAALTNCPGGPAPGRSRGLLVRDVLTATDHDEALATVSETLTDRSYAGFHLVVATPSTASLVTWDGERRDRSLARDVHVVTNDGHHDEDPRAAAVRSRLLGATDEDVEAYRDRLRTVLADHAIPICVHGEERGTRSSSIVSRRESGEVRWDFADGRPCTSTYQTVHNGNFKRDSSHSTRQ